MAEVEEGGAGSSLQALRRDTEGLADAMRQNVERVAQRGDNVDRLLEKGQQLDQSAQQFERVAVRTERRMLWRNRRMKLIIAAVVIVALLIATIAIAIAVHRGGGDGGGDGGGGGHLANDVTAVAFVFRAPLGGVALAGSDVTSRHVGLALCPTQNPPKLQQHHQQEQQHHQQEQQQHHQQEQQHHQQQRPQRAGASPPALAARGPRPRLARVPALPPPSSAGRVWLSAGERRAGPRVPVVEGIPYLTAEDARKITEADSDSDSAAKSGADRPAASEPGAAEPR
ncbi:unnamed protein product [Lampetra fluviatilis]